MQPHLYSHLSMDLRQTGEWTTEGIAPVTADLRTPGGIRASLAALLLEGSFGDNLLAHGFPVLSQMTFHLRDGAADVARLRAEGELVHMGKRRASGRGCVVDADDPDRLIGFGTIGFTMIQPDGDYMPADLEASLEASRDVADRAEQKAPESAGSRRVGALEDPAVAEALVEGLLNRVVEIAGPQRAAPERRPSPAMGGGSCPGPGTQLYADHAQADGSAERRMPRQPARPLRQAAGRQPDDSPGLVRS